MSSEKWPTWLVSYGYEGKRWTIDVVAPTAEEAKKRLEIAAAFGTVDGELVARVPVWGGGIFLPLVCWGRNLVSIASKANRERAKK